MSPSSPVSSTERPLPRARRRRIACLDCRPRPRGALALERWQCALSLSTASCAASRTLTLSLSGRGPQSTAPPPRQIASVGVECGRNAARCGARCSVHPATPRSAATLRACARAAHMMVPRQRRSTVSSLKSPASYELRARNRRADSGSGGSDRAVRPSRRHLRARGGGRTSSCRHDERRRAEEYARLRAPKPTRTHRGLGEVGGRRFGEAALTSRLGLWYSYTVGWAHVEESYQIGPTLLPFLSVLELYINSLGTRDRTKPRPCGRLTSSAVERTSGGLHHCLRACGEALSGRIPRAFGA